MERMQIAEVNKLLNAVYEAMKVIQTTDKTIDCLKDSGSKRIEEIVDKQIAKSSIVQNIVPILEQYRTSVKIVETVTEELYARLPGARPKAD